VYGTTGKGGEVRWNEAFLLQLQGDWKTQDMEITVLVEGEENPGGGLGTTYTHLGESMKGIGMGEEKSFNLGLVGEKEKKGTKKGKGVEGELGYVVFSITLYSTPPDGFDLGDGVGGGEVEEGGKEEKEPKKKKKNKKKKDEGSSEEESSSDEGEEGEKKGGKKGENKGTKEVDVTRMKKEGIDVWVGEKTFWNRKKEEKFILSLSDPQIGEDGTLTGSLAVENKSKGIRNKWIQVWMKVKGEQVRKGKKRVGHKAGKKQKLKGTQKALTETLDLSVKIPEFDKGNVLELTMHIQAGFDGVHATMAMVVDLTEFVPEAKMAEKK